MSYTKTNWNNTTAPAINDTNLNKIENGIADVDGAIGYDSYSNSSTYAVGDYCIYNNKLYKCTTAVSSAEDFDSTKWTETNIKNLINSLNSIDFSGLVTFDEANPANSMFRRSGKVVTISFRGAAVTHATDSNIFTIPSGYRPATNIYAPFIKGGTAYGVLEIAAQTGVARVVFVSSTTSTDRLVVNISYVQSN